MDQPPTENPQPQPGRRAFNLTPAPADQPGEAAAPRRFGRKSRRNLLIGGSAAIPFITTIASRPGFAKKSKGGGLSHAAASTPHKTKKKTGSLTRGGDTVAMWQENYPKLMESHTVEAQAFPGKATAHGYLGNPSLASVFSVPVAAVNGVGFTAPDADLHSALYGRGSWEIFVTHNGETARRVVGGDFFAEATAALLNGAVYGEASFGLTDAMVIAQVNRSFESLQSHARTLAALNPGAGAGEILNQLVKHIEGGLDVRGETYYLAQLNSRSPA